MEWLQLAVFIVAITTQPVTSGTACELIVALPSHYDSEPVPTWERGLEIFSGVHIVSERIRNISNCKLNLTEVKIGRCGSAKNLAFYLSIYF